MGLPGALLLVSMLALTACAPTAEPVPTASSTPTPTRSATASATPTPTPTGVGLVPEGSADDNLPLFSEVVEDVWASDDKVSGRAYIDALIAAGFDKSAMQVTEDESTVGNPAESIQFSVRWGDECLVGQVGPATGDPVVVVLPGLDAGGCLVGNTRPIDW
ncbi:hypothetical protein Microterr_14450 [Microbacterium terricola]|uniref:DUF6993 domain-containing protein n=1 Tax=Microbacterium terricola TaxID=344163 RepID=A0ABM8DYW6_9MICO|nr:hypothetical protein Microterr_14450 [Microbacterium terricola]